MNPLTFYRAQLLVLSGGGTVRYEGYASGRQTYGVRIFLAGECPLWITLDC